MPVPTHIFDPPFNIVRCSHVVLDVVDLNASSEFYANTVGLHVEDRDDSARAKDRDRRSPVPPPPSGGDRPHRFQCRDTG